MSTEHGDADTYRDGIADIVAALDGRLPVLSSSNGEQPGTTPHILLKDGRLLVLFEGGERGLQRVSAMLRAPLNTAERELLLNDFDSTTEPPADKAV